LAQGDAPGAKAIYERILVDAPQNADALSMLGAIYAETGDPTRAKSLLESALGANPAHPDAHYQLANLYRRAGQLDQAKSHYEFAVMHDPEHVEALVGLASVQGPLGNAHEAEASARRAVALADDFADAHVNLGNALVQQGRIEEALGAYLRATEIDPSLAAVWLLAARAAVHLGQYADAVTWVRRARAVDSGLKDCALVLGDALRGQEKYAEAATNYREASAADPGNAEILAKLGMVWHETGELGKARDAMQKVVGIAPDVASYRLALAAILLDTKETVSIQAAEGHLRRAVEIDPYLAGVHYKMGNCLAALNKLAEAEASYVRALEDSVGAWDSRSRLGAVQHALGRFDDAARTFREVLASQPDDLTATLGLGAALQALGDYTGSVATYARAADNRPEDAEPHFALGTALMNIGNPAQAEESFERAIQLDPNRADCHVGLASALMVLGDHTRARAQVNEALRLAPESVDALTLSATIAEHLDDHQSAMETLARVFDRAPDDVNAAVCFASLARAPDQKQLAISRIERLLEEGRVQRVTERRNLLFALGKLYDAIGEWDKAFDRYAAGNQLKPISFDPAQHVIEVESMLRIFSAEFLATRPRASVRSDRPVFVVGMPRSGTTLVEQILSSHPQVYGAGELTDVIQMVTTMHVVVGSEHRYPQCAPLISQHHLDVLAGNYLQKIAELSPDAARVVDKMPGNFMHLGLISMLFPGARVIHCMRDPMDTCLSGFFQDFSRSHPYSYELYNLGRFYRSYERVMQHWRGVLRLPMHEVQYEQLVEDPEVVTREMLAFLGLPWDATCLRFHESGRHARTASYDQVRQPIYKTSMARWKHYEKHLEQLRSGLGWQEA
jgi:tetratricopeptide (TPR) repeat protein